MYTETVTHAPRARTDIQAELAHARQGPMKPSVLAALRRKLGLVGLHLDPGELERLYDVAWQALYARLLAGEWLDGKQAAFEAFLVQVAFRRAVDEERDARLSRASA